MKSDTDSFLSFTAGASGFQARVSSANNGGNIEIRLDSESGPLVGTCEISSTGSWQTWVTKSCKVDGISDTHAVCLKFTGGNGDLFNINWFKFIANNTNSAVQSVSKP